MKNFLVALFMTLFMTLCFSVHAQNGGIRFGDNLLVPTQPPNTSNNTPASTQFVQNAIQLIPTGPGLSPARIDVRTFGAVGNSAVFTGSISSTTLTITSIYGALRVGETIFADTITNGTTITSVPAGGGPGSYGVSISQNVASQQMIGVGTDDTVAIVNAEAFLEANYPAGGCLYFPANYVFLLTANNTLTPIGSGLTAAVAIQKSNVCWEGDGSASILAVASWPQTPASTLQAFINVSTPSTFVSNFSAHDLQFAGGFTETSNPGPSSANFFQCGTSTFAATVSNCGFYNIYANGLAGTPFNFDGGNFNSGPSGFEYGCYVLNSTVEHQANTDVVNFLSGAWRNCTISGNRINHSEGICIEGIPHPGIISYNIFYDCRGADIASEDNLVINTISSGTYNSATGLVTLTLSAGASFQTGSTMLVADLTGTGNFTSLAGYYVATVSGVTVTYTAATGLGAVTITGGNALCCEFGVTEIANNISWMSGQRDGVSGTTGGPNLELGEANGSSFMYIHDNTWLETFGQCLILGGTYHYGIDIKNNICKFPGIGNRTPALAGGIAIGAQNITNGAITGNIVYASQSPSQITVGLGSGGNVQNEWVDGNISVGIWAVAPFFTGCSAGINTNNLRVGSNYDVTAGISHGCFNNSNQEWAPQKVLPMGNQTVDLSGSDVWELFGNAGGSTITGFTGIAFGKPKQLIFQDANITINNGGGNGGIVGNNGANITSSATMQATCTEGGVAGIFIFTNCAYNK
jgi:hypothetical protein